MDYIYGNNNKVLIKDFPDSFLKTHLQQQLVDNQVGRIIITGIQSEICVDATCRRAFSLGYVVIFVEDSHSTCDSDILKACQIINHHNNIHYQWFAKVKK
ncbi:MAG: isochorismatase family protein [Heyndrickxia oleronia]|nr:isochorismatase family protein [Heyndrickxia oleronia]MCI1591027.1 isochorismatase family protein [Heyndrickxia oleronia]MCI1613086.1 isochorismatase family protein [Heyndrickxia oleronia]MCI1761024.1 isochorismatase family protein [Heyndrickxia oleronia]